MRSMIVYVLPSNEAAKIFCVIEFLKNILGLIGPVVFGKMYKNRRSLSFSILTFGNCYEGFGVSCESASLP